ncbi:FCD domain-containing protein [Bacillus subtilis]|uniref:FadR/GntR family transcriptional regulator n=1 Tax=Pseudochrobactrum asaccharolyticum TaxID=354351 RepID=UPI001F48C4B6|nr:FCD domain-containing protein [Pseudochrobactrum asaccharolyticum]MCF7644054.1 FCD domain-containing protein [Pseudochrobactrum asaccharolyticum]MCF7670708.1 FCD domain-containing protein [Bacillus subtilis]
MNDLSQNSDFALEQLRALLADQTSDQEHRLPSERELAARFNVSRRALRAALDILENEGLIWRQQGQGTFSGERRPTGNMPVNQIATFTNPIEVMDVRIEIEPALARMAAARATPALIEQLEKLALKAEQADDVASWEKWDSAFHSKIADASGNQLFIAIMSIIDEIRRNNAWQQFRTRVRSTGRNSLSVTQHNAILDAIRRFHPLDAEEAMRTHLISLREAVIEEIGGVARAQVRQPSMTE